VEVTVATFRPGFKQVFERRVAPWFVHRSLAEAFRHARVRLACGHPSSREVAIVRVLLGIAALPLVLGLTSCSEDDPEPILAPTPTASPTPSSTATETGPSETPEEFIRRWVELSNEMQVTGETEEYLAISSGCRPCNLVANDVEEIHGAGGFVRTDGWEILKFIRSSGPAKRPSEVETLPGGRLIERFHLERMDSSWTMINLSQVPS
jgi:hypothetical protein